MPIKKISDLKVNEEYFYTFIGDDEKFVKKCKLLAIINEQVELQLDRTELYIELAESTNLVPIQEIGIGCSKKEAIANYAKFKFEANPDFDITYQGLHEKLSKKSAGRGFLYHRNKYV